MTVAVFVAEFMMAISGAHPEPRSVILAALAEDTRATRQDEPHDESTIER